jgi:hypothetical protein
MMARWEPTKANNKTNNKETAGKGKKSQKDVDSNLDDGYIGANKGNQQGKQQQIKGGGNHDHLHECRDRTRPEPLE